MTHQITVHTYLPLHAGTATLIEDVPVAVTICGEDDGCGELHFWIEEICAEFIGKDLVMDWKTATAKNPFGGKSIEHLIMKQLFDAAENDESIRGEIADQLEPLVFGRDAA